MPEPSGEQVVRGSTALGAFVRRWGLALNPEDLDQMAYAVLLHAGSAGGYDEIVAAVERQIDAHELGARQMAAAMQAEIDRGKQSGALNRAMQAEIDRAKQVDVGRADSRTAGRVGDGPSRPE